MNPSNSNDDIKDSEFKKQHLSLVFPALNECESLSELYDKVNKAINKLSVEVEMIFVDDGSSDNSMTVLKELQSKDKRVKIIQFRRNFGKAAAYSAAFEYAKGEIIITMDADLQDDPSEIPQFIDKINEGYDMVIGWRYQRKGPFDKTIPSIIFNKIVRFVTGIRLHDFNCPFKAYRKEVLEEIVIHGELHRFIPVLADSKGFKMTEIKIGNLPRLYGNSKYGMERYLRGMLDLATVIFVTRFSKRPLHFLGVGGIAVCTLGTLILLILISGHSFYLIGLTINESWNIHDRPALSLGILLIIVGIQFISLGLLGELIVNSLSCAKKESGYSIKQIISD